MFLFTVQIIFSFHIPRLSEFPTKKKNCLPRDQLEIIHASLELIQRVSSFFPSYDIVRFKQSNCRAAPRLVWPSLRAESRSVDNKLPWHQSRVRKGRDIIKPRRVNLIIRLDSDANCISRYSPLMFRDWTALNSARLTIPTRQIKKYQRRL